MRSFGQEPQCILTMPLLEGTDAREENGAVVGPKMSKSLGNTIGVEDEPLQQFGKVMSVCDALMWRFYKLLSTKTADEVEALRQGHPKAAKATLARELVARYHGPEAAERAQVDFDRMFPGTGKKSGDIPDDAPTVTLDGSKGPVTVLRALVEAALVESNSDGRRLIAQGGLLVDGERVTDAKVELTSGTHAVRAGKTRWARLIVG
jgi:tyrosyl-tRNA synthetase